MSNPALLRHEADRAAATLPPLLARAYRVAATVAGEHGRRQAGRGESFWQYRRAMPGDPLPAIDWRRSARSDELYVRETEWELAQTVWLWVDRAASMDFSSGGENKADRAALLGLALGVMLARAGERFGMLGDPRPMQREAGLGRLALKLTAPVDEGDFGVPPAVMPGRRTRAVFFSDFFADLNPVSEALRRAAENGVEGALVQVVDPAEEAFPYSGRVVFESMGGALSYDADRAESLREAYQARLAERRERLTRLARASGWRFFIHRTDASPSVALLWLYEALSSGGTRWSAKR